MLSIYIFHVSLIFDIFVTEQNRAEAGNMPNVNASAFKILCCKFCLWSNSVYSILTSPYCQKFNKTGVLTHELSKSHRELERKN